MKTSNLFLALVPALAFYACGGSSDDAPLKKGTLNVGLAEFKAYINGIELSDTVKPGQTDGICQDATIGLVYIDPILGVSTNQCNAPSFANQIQIIRKGASSYSDMLPLSVGAPKLDPLSSNSTDRKCRIEYTILGGADIGQTYQVQVAATATGVARTSYEFQVANSFKLCNGGFRIAEFAGSSDPFVMPVSATDGNSADWDFGRFWDAAVKNLGDTFTVALKSVIKSDSGEGAWKIRFTRPAKLADVQRGVSIKKGFSSELVAVTVEAVNPSQNAGEVVATDFNVKPQTKLEKGIYIISVQTNSAQGEKLTAAKSSYGEVIAFNVMNVGYSFFELLAILAQLVAGS